MRMLIKKLLKKKFGYTPLNIDMRLRYIPVIKMLKKYKKKKENILEVGSGRLGLTAFLKEEITGLDFNFDLPISPYLQPLVYDGKKFPLKNKAYDWVICLDTLEHIKRNKRPLFLKELIRVTKKWLILGFPEGKMTYNQDSFFLKRQNKFYKESGALREHVDYGPINQKEIFTMIKKFCDRARKTVYQTKIINNTNLFLHFIILYLSISRFKVFNYLYRGLYIFYPLIEIFSNFGKCYRKIIIYRFKK